MTRTGKVNKLRQHIDKACLEIHPSDAEDRNIEDGDVVVISNTRGTVRVCARVTDEIKKGVVFLPMHWGKILSSDQARANNLTSHLTDPVSKEPDFKFAVVQVERYEKPFERIVVVGAGAAAYRFLCSYRALNKRDELVVISKEDHSFYNRVLLPEYVNDHMPWQKLQKFRPGEMEELDFTLYAASEVTSINRREKYVVDQSGRQHAYDKLVLATGTRAHLPNDAPTLPGVFTMRTKRDADNLKPYLQPDNHIVIIGGGLLGLELAVSLREADVAVSILQLGSRLMERQIDNIAGQLLLDFIDEKGITVYMNDQLLHTRRNETTGELQIELRSGKTLRGNAMVFAVGTRPNIEFAQESGIETARGIIVNDFMQTNDPDIFAIGEIAEHNGRMLGITSAAEKQADVLARYLHGDLQSRYEGAVAMNILKLSGLDLCSIGLGEAPASDEGYDEVLFIDKASRYYKKCIIKNDRLVGAILVGDKTEFAEFKNLIENKIELSEKRLSLLRSGRKVEPVQGKLVCSCNQVGEGNLQALIDQGHQKLNAVCELSGAGLGCGSCKPEIQAIIRRRVESKEATTFSLPVETLT
jgi:ferredoxin-nitrate reductase